MLESINYANAQRAQGLWKHLYGIQFEIRGQVMRTDDNNNPAAFTTDVASQVLELGVDYEIGTGFPAPSRLITAKLIGDPIAITIKLLDSIGYYTKAGKARWTYIAIPHFIWKLLTYDQKRDIIGFHYQNEGGTAMRHLFPNYGEK